MKRNRRHIILAVLLAGILVLLTAAAALADDVTLTVQVEVEYCYSETESMLEIINEFRTSDTWYWNADDTTKTEVTGLEGLTYDYGLERAAMIRAAEIAVYFEHQRPNGESCFTVDNSLRIAAENIAAGQRSKEAAFDSWREENESSADQGHRRNMLNSGFTRIGIGCVKANGVYYWVQEFGRDASGESRSSLKSPATFLLSPAVVELTDAAASAESLKIREGESAELPTVSAKAGWAEAPLTILDAPWASGNTEILSLTDGKASALKGGKAKLTVSLGSDVAVDVVCVCKEHTLDDGVVTTAATCTATGILTRTCTVCGETVDEVIPMVPHTLEKTEKKDSTCTETGYEEYWTCSVCKKLFSDDKAENEITEPVVIALKPHTLEKTEKKDSTCTGTGYEEYWTCSVCKELFSDEKAENEIKEPIVIALKPHTLEKTEEVEPTCTETGTEEYWTCSVCKKLFSDKDAEKEITEPKKTDALGHDWDDGEITTEPTCSEDGVKTFTCKRCDEKREEAVEHGHKLVKVDRKEATETELGHEAYWECSACGALFGDENGSNEITAPPPAFRIGWNLVDGVYYYWNGDSTEKEWKYIDGVWYFFNRRNGAMVTGWLWDNGVWYYFKPSGAMATGWVEDDGSWYYMSSSGAMYTGWLQSGKDWYLLKPNGAMATGWASDGGAWYYFKPSGAMATGWQQVGGSWYYLKDSGAMATGWFRDKQAEAKLPRNQKKELWYWFDENGVMATGWKEINGQWEMFDENSGLWLYTWQGN